MDISTSLNVFYGNGYTIEEGIKRCVKAGFTALDFNYWDHQAYVHTLSWDEEKAWAEQIRKWADLTGVRFNQMHGPVHGPNYEEMVLGLNENTFLEMAIRSVRTAAILGLQWIVFHPTKAVPQQVSYKQHLEKNMQFYSKLIPVLEETGVGIALENLVDKEQSEAGVPRRNYCSIPEELVELIDAIDHPLVGACWDTGHANRQGLDQYASITLLGKRLKALHINDNNGKQDLHMMPYTGNVDWKSITDALSDIAYEHDFTYEAHRSIKRLPDDLRDAGLVNAVQIAQYLVSQIKTNHKVNV